MSENYECHFLGLEWGDLLWLSLGGLYPGSKLSLGAVKFNTEINTVDGDYLGVEGSCWAEVGSMFCM